MAAQDAENCRVRHFVVVIVLQAPDNPHWAKMIFAPQARCHHVRRMFAASGNPVESLHRVSLGNLSLPRGHAVRTVKAADA